MSPGTGRVLRALFDFPDEHKGFGGFFIVLSEFHEYLLWMVNAKTRGNGACQITADNLYMPDRKLGCLDS